MVCVDAAYDSARLAILAKFDVGGDCAGEGGTIPPVRAGQCWTVLGEAMWDWAVATIADTNVYKLACASSILNYFAAGVHCVGQTIAQAEALANCMGCAVNDCCACDSCPTVPKIYILVTGFSGPGCTLMNGKYELAPSVDPSWCGPAGAKCCYFGNNPSARLAVFVCRNNCSWQISCGNSPYLALDNTPRLWCSTYFSFRGTGILTGYGSCTGQTRAW